jgi:predicted TIM-barrel fold metal-dependent hydrolase
MQLNDMILVSVDDHNIEPPDAFIRHFPLQHRDKAPRIVQRNGKDVWFFKERFHPTVGSNAVVGRPRTEYGIEPDSFSQMRKGCFDPKARVDDMNVNGVLASVNFPTFPQFAGGTFLADPDDLALVAIRAYNDWHVHDWCGAAPERLIPVAILPLWDMAATLDELKRVSALGVHSISFPDNPTKADLPSIHNEYWEPLWKACVDHEILINCHIGSGNQAPHASPETPIPAWITTMPISIVNAAADWLYAPMWKKHPTLKMALSEGGIGWIPYFVERADFTHRQHSEWTHVDLGGARPSEVFKRHFITCFLDDEAGLELLHHMNEDLVTWECDYPHSDTLWPNCPERLWETMHTLPKATIDKITHENALKQYRFDPFPLMGGRENCTVGALRELGKNVDVSPRANLGGARPGSPDGKPVTSGDIARLLTGA